MAKAKCKDKKKAVQSMFTTRACGLISNTSQSPMFGCNALSISLQLQCESEILMRIRSSVGFWTISHWCHFKQSQMQNHLRISMKALECQNCMSSDNPQASKSNCWVLKLDPLKCWNPLLSSQQKCRAVVATQMFRMHQHFGLQNLEQWLAFKPQKILFYFVDWVSNLCWLCALTFSIVLIQNSC